MSLERVDYDPPLTRLLTAAGIFASDPFRLIDVGCSGGLEPYWRAFEPDLVAAGFDPLIEECERLGGLETNPNVRYHPRWVRDPEMASRISGSLDAASRTGGAPESTQTYHRSSSIRANEILALSVTERYSPATQTITLTTEETSVDGFIAGEGWSGLDFLKIDTDGGDYEVLRSADQTLGDLGILGVTIESQFHGVTHEHGNTFASIDRHMRDQGYTLFDLDIYRYSRRALPDRFTYDITAQTDRGQVGFGEALYLWDAAHPGRAERREAASPLRLAKLLCLYEIFGLDDCAAELILTERERFDTLFDTASALDVLARAWWPGVSGYDEVLKAFEHDPRAFLRHGHFNAAPAPPAEAPAPPEEMTPTPPEAPATQSPGAVARAVLADVRQAGEKQARRLEQWLGTTRRWPR